MRIALAARIGAGRNQRIVPAGSTPGGKTTGLEAVNSHLAILLVTLAIGLSVLWSGPRKLANQSIAVVAFLASGWMLLLWSLRTSGFGNPVPRLRTIAVLASVFPLFLWWLGYVVRNPSARWRDLVGRGGYWVIFSLALGGVACTEWYIPSSSTPQHKVWGVGYAWHTLGLLGALLALLVQAVRWVWTRRGEARTLALGFWLGGTVACLLGVTLTAGLRLVGHAVSPGWAQWVALVFFLGIALLITTRRLFDSHIRLLALVRRVVGVILAAYLVEGWIRFWSDRPAAEIAFGSAVIGAVFLGAYELLSGWWMREWLRRDSQAVVSALQELSAGLRKMAREEIEGKMATRLGAILSCDDVAIYLRRRPETRFERFACAGEMVEAPAVLTAESAILQEWDGGRLEWEIREVEDSHRAWVQRYVLGLRQGDPDGVEVIAFLSRPRRRAGLVTVEVAAVQSLLMALQQTITSREIAALEVAQRQLIETGKIAAGVAHNIRNPLAVVRAYVEADPSLEPETRSELHRLAIEEVAHIQRVVDGLSTLARGELFTLLPCDLHAMVVAAADAQAKYLASCGARADVRFGAGSHAVLAESAQMATALTNLLRNAAEEIAKTGVEGRIEISVAEETAEFVTLRLADTGRGLPPEIEQAVFTRDLFAKTTKPQGSVGRATGYGLGLHSTMLIVNIGHGGRFSYRDHAFYLALRRAPAVSPGREK